MATETAQALLRDIAEAIDTVFGGVATAVVMGDEPIPLHSIRDPDLERQLITLPSVRAALAAGAPCTCPPPVDGPFTEAALVAIEPLDIVPGGESATLVFALRDSAETERAVMLAHTLAAEAANQLVPLEQTPSSATALEAVESAISVADATLEDSPLVYVNDGFTRLTGYSRSEALGRNCRFLQAPLTDQPGSRVMQNALNRGVGCTTTLTNMRRNGERFQSRVRLQPIRLPDGRLSHIVGIQSDASAEQAALESIDLQRRRHESVMDSVANYVWHMDTNGELQQVDPAWLALVGLDDGPNPPDVETIEPFSVSYPLPPGSASPQWFQDHVTPVRDESGALLEWYGVTQEITALRHAEQQQDLHQIMQTAPIGMLVVNQAGRIEYANTQAGHLFDYPVESLRGMSVDRLVPDHVRGRHPKLRASFLETPYMRQMGLNREVQGIRRDGTAFDAEVSLNWFGTDDEPRVIATIADKTEIKQAYRAVEHTAYHDRVTGLLSRDGFAGKLDEIRKTADPHPASMIVSMDITGLREINNAQGYEAGDEVLREAGQRLSGIAGEPDRVARPGGGEFLLMATVDRRYTPAWWRRRLEAAFDVPFEINGFTLNITVAFGYVRVGRSLQQASETLMNNAELALRKSQQKVSVKWSQYTRALEQKTRASVITTRELRLALERDELALHYQPKVDMGSGCPVAAEALLRWDHAERGAIAPASFIPLAEQSQLIGPIGEWVLRRTCRDLRRWQDAGLTVRPVSVNVSLVQFQIGSVPAIVQRALEEFDIEPCQLTLEITESVFEEDSDALKHDLCALAEMGVRLSLDDFGTGYSSLGHLKNYAFDEIKIDKSFTWQLNDGHYGEAIVRAIDAIATAIDAQVVAEGVESDHHVAVLQRLGCRIGQGFHYYRPMPELQWRGELDNLSTAPPTARPSHPSD